VPALVRLLGPGNSRSETTFWAACFYQAPLPPITTSHISSDCTIFAGHSQEKKYGRRTISWSTCRCRGRVFRRLWHEAI